MLAEPGKIGTMVIKNRLVMPAMCTNYTYQGHFTDQAIQFYRLRAQGGVGLIILEASAIEYPIGRGVLNAAVSEDVFIPSLKRLVNEVHPYGAKVVLQLNHCGRQTDTKRCGSRPVSSSSVPSDMSNYGDPPRPLTLYECKRVVKHFAEAALRAQKAGFDGVELHFAHGYLMSSFLSPALNLRKDEYGGLEGGLKICAEVIGQVKEKCGIDYPVICRINGDDYHPNGGLTHIESRMVAVALEKAGADCLSVSGGVRESTHPLYDHTMACPRGAWVYLAEGVKKAVNIPVMAVKRISEDMAEDIVARGQADFVCVGRPHIADPDYGNKVLSGRKEEVIPCIWCAQGCSDALMMFSPIGCMVNPGAGRPDEQPLDRLAQAPVSKKVAVVGGGPAGCEASLIAAKRGHKVTLFEKGRHLGGVFRLASNSPSKREVERLFTYFERALGSAGVRVELGTEGTPENIEALAPEVAVIATGAQRYIPETIPGIVAPHVVRVDDVIAGKVEVGYRVVIWTCSYWCRYTCAPVRAPIEGDPTGLQSSRSFACTNGYGAVDTAEFLASQGKLVSIITERDAIVPGMGYTSRSSLLQRLYRANVRISNGVKLQKIKGQGLVVRKAGMTFFLDADTLIVSVSSSPSRLLADLLQGRVDEIYTIGDCDSIGNAMKAIHSGYHVAMRIGETDLKRG